VDNASGAEGRGRRVDAGDDLLFPSDGNFSRVVPLTEAGEELAASAVAPEPYEPDEPEEREDEVVTLVPARVSRGALQARASRPGKGVEQSWGLTAAVLAVSVAAGVAAGAYMIRSQRPAGALRHAAPGAEASAANGAVEKVPASGPAEQPVPQASAPQVGRDGLAEVEHDKVAAATAPAAAPAARASSDEADTKAESVSASTPSPKASARASDTTARRAAEPGTRAERPARAEREARAASPAPRPPRSDAAPRHADRPASASADTREHSLPISSPPPSARPKKVIQWP